MRTRRYFTLIALVVSGFAGALAAEWAANVKKDSGIGLAVRGDEVFDFGNVHENETLTHVFAVANTGNSNITIADYRSSCSCTVLTDLRGLVLPSGDVLQLPVSIRTGVGEGRIASVVSLYYCQSAAESGTKEGSVTLGLEGTIVPYLWRHHVSVA